MTINLKIPDIREMKPRITVFGVGGAGGNAVNNMITAGLLGVDFVVANTDAQALTMSKAERIIQMGAQVTEGLGAGSQPEVGRAAAEEVIDEIRDHLSGAHMVFVTAGMGGGTGTGAAPVIAKVARDMGILTVGVVTKPFHFEGQRRMRFAETGIVELQKVVDTLLIIPNQNLFRVANEKTTFADAFAMADQVLYSGVACITDLMVKEGLINLDFADVRAVMREMGKAMMGTGEACGEKRALTAAEAAIANPLIDDASMKGARGSVDLDHRRQGPDALRGRRSRHPHPRGSRSGRQYHRRRHLRRKPGRHHPRVGGGDRHRRQHRAAHHAGAGRERAQGTGRPHPHRQPPHRRPHRAHAARGRAAAGCFRARAAARNGRGGRSARIGGAGSGGRRHPAAVGAAARGVMEDVSIRPMPMKPSLFEPAPAEAAAAEPPTPRTFIPPPPERVAAPPRAPRMPRIDELPLPAQNEIRAQRGEPAENHPEKQRLSLMQRLAQVGLGRREEGEAPQAPRTAQPMPMPQVERPRAAAERAPAGRAAGAAGIGICPARGAGTAGSRPARPARTCA